MASAEPWLRPSTLRTATRLTAVRRMDLLFMGGSLVSRRRDAPAKVELGQRNRVTGTSRVTNFEYLPQTEAIRGKMCLCPPNSRTS